ncbi:MAG: LysM peptidoglycan-binding domain-containing protein [Nitrospiraceae bacterium]
MNQVMGLSLIVVACLALSMGCTAGRSTPWQLETTTAKVQADNLLHENDAELSVLRRDLATARIATSKQEGEAAELVRKTALLEVDRAELRKMLAQAHVAVHALEHERDELKQALTQTQALHLADQNSIDPTKLGRIDAHVDIKELKARMIQLTNEVAQLQQRFLSMTRTTAAQPLQKSAAPPVKATTEWGSRDESSPPRIVPNAAFMASSASAIRSGHAEALSPQPGLIRVLPGDSLWKIALRHATTVEKLKHINALTTDTVQAGQRLLLPPTRPIRVSP